MARWAELPLDKELYANVDETLLSNRNAAMENAYMNPANGQSRFPGRRGFAAGLSGQRTYLSEWRGNLVAATDAGDVYRIDKAGTVEDVTDVKVGGGRRAIFDRTEEELLIAAGSRIIRLASNRTEILSEDAPESTHVAFIDGFIIAIEPFSGRFYHNNPPGQYRQWDPIDVFTAEGKPDDLNACIVTPFRELLLCGEDSIEQHERQASASIPFARRWATGEGLYAPYTLVAEDNGTYGINKLREFVRFRQQVSQPQSDEVDFVFEKVDELAPDQPDAWKDAWAEQIHIKGQKFIVLQIPHATNPYGTQGITALFDHRFRRWSNLYDWDVDAGVPTRWAPWSYQPMWGRHFVGVPGGVEELSDTAYDHAGVVQRVLVRSGHIDQFGPSRFDNLRLRLRRGTTDPNAGREAEVWIRANRDNRGFGRWKQKNLGRHGDRTMVIEFGAFGEADTWQFEIAVTDAVPVEIVGLSALVTRLRW